VVVRAQQAPNKPPTEKDSDDKTGSKVDKVIEVSTRVCGHADWSVPAHALHLRSAKLTTQHAALTALPAATPPDRHDHCQGTPDPEDLVRGK
jgi:hypothetical protein